MAIVSCCFVSIMLTIELKGFGSVFGSLMQCLCA